MVLVFLPALLASPSRPLCCCFRSFRNNIFSIPLHQMKFINRIYSHSLRKSHIFQIELTKILMTKTEHLRLREGERHYKNQF